MVKQKMMRCKVCRTAVVPSRLAMFEHVITAHALELLRDPARLTRAAQSPELRLELAREIIARAAATIGERKK